MIRLKKYSTDFTLFLMILTLIIGTVVSFNHLSAQKTDAQITNNSNNISTSNTRNQFTGFPKSEMMNNTGTNVNGSVSILSVIAQAITSQLNNTLGNATTIAGQMSGNNTRAVSAYLGIENGFLVYTVWTVDPESDNIHKIVFDIADGKILSSEQIPIVEMMNGIFPDSIINTNITMGK